MATPSNPAVANAIDDLGRSSLGSKYVANSIGMRTRTRISYVLLLDEMFLEPKIGIPKSSIAMHCDSVGCRCLVDHFRGRSGDGCMPVSNVRVFFQLKSLGFELAWVGIVGALLQPGMLCLERLGERKRGVRLLTARAERAPSAQWYGGTRRALRPRRGPLPRGWAISPCQPLPDPLEHNSVVCAVFSDLREHSRQV